MGGNNRRAMPVAGGTMTANIASFDRIQATIDAGGSLSNVDFADMGMGLEEFLRYAQFNPAQVQCFHRGVPAVFFAIRRRFGTGGAE